MVCTTKVDVLQEETTDAAPGVTSDVTKQAQKRLVVRRRDDGGHAINSVITKAGYQVIEQLARNGASNGEIARQIGVASSTFVHIRKRDPEVDEALQRGRSALDTEFVDRFVEWSRKGIVTAAIYFTKARLGWREDGSNAPGVQVNNTQININMPPAMTAEQFAALIAPPQQDQPQKEVIDVEAIR
jgi:hypothetical protein